MNKLLVFRSYISTYSIYFFTYILPILHSIHIINSDNVPIREKVEKMKSYLKYWSILMFSQYMYIVLQYLYMILYFKTVLPQIPYELRVLYLLFLNYYNGSEYLYQHVLAPLFKEHESLIDHTINYVLLKVQSAVTRHFQNILWQILYNPNDGLISGTLQTLTTLFFKYSILLNITPSNNNSNTSKEQDTSAAAVTSQNLGRLLLVEFRHLMIEGIILEATTLTANTNGLGFDTSHSNFAISFQSAKLSLSRKGFSILIEAYTNNNNNNATEVSLLKIEFPVVCITDVCEFHTYTSKLPTSTSMLHHKTEADQIIVIQYIDPTITLPLPLVADTPESLENNKMKPHKSKSNRFSSYLSSFATNTNNNNNNNNTVNNNTSVVSTSPNINSTNAADIENKKITRVISSSNTFKTIFTNTNTNTNTTQSKEKISTSTTAVSNNNNNGIVTPMTSYHPVQYLLLQSEDHDEGLSLLTGLQILATSTRGTFVKKLSYLNYIRHKVKLRNMFHLWKITHLERK